MAQPKVDDLLFDRSEHRGALRSGHLPTASTQVRRIRRKSKIRIGAGIGVVSFEIVSCYAARSFSLVVTSEFA